MSHGGSWDIEYMDKKFQKAATSLTIVNHQVIELQRLIWKMEKRVEKTRFDFTVLTITITAVLVCLVLGFILLLWRSRKDYYKRQMETMIRSIQNQVEFYNQRAAVMRTREAFQEMSEN